MVKATLSVLFRISMIAMLLGGLVVVVLQSGGLIAGDGEFVTMVDEVIAPWAYGAAGAAALLAFALSYFSHEVDTAFDDEEESERLTSAAQV
jgi:hypothetical protein